MKSKHTITNAFRVAFHGIGLFFSKERNGKIQLSIAAITIVVSIILHISAIEWMFILICISTVILTEMLNAAVEKVCDMLSSDYHPGIKIIKDISAGAVLWASIISAIIGCIIFIPKIAQWWR